MDYNDQQPHRDWDAPANGDAPAEGQSSYYDDDPNAPLELPSRRERINQSRRQRQKQQQEEARAAKKSVTRKKVVARKRARNYLGWVVLIIVAVAAAFVIRAFVFEIIEVDGASMYPTLHTGERVATEKVTRYKGLPERGDIIIVEYPDMPGTYVKRAIGLPGETVEVKGSTVYIDGVPLDEPYTNKESPYADMAPTVVPADSVFVMGDNRSNSMDSRSEKVGPIPHDAIIGHGMFVIWPLDDIHEIDQEWPYPV